MYLEPLACIPRCIQSKNCIFVAKIDFYSLKLIVIWSCVCISKCIQCILGGDIHTTPTIVRINTFLRSIDKIDDYKMVS